MSILIVAFDDNQYADNTIRVRVPDNFFDIVSTARKSLKALTGAKEVKFSLEIERDKWLRFEVDIEGNVIFQDIDSGKPYAYIKIEN